MELLIGILFVMNVSAFLLDRALIATKQREAIMADWWISLRLKPAAIISVEINQRFMEIFDTIYGKKTWSPRRIITSYISSLLAVFFLALVLGWEGTALDNYITKPSFLVAVFLLNPIIDYISLAETRWVLSKMVNTNSQIRIISYLVFDLILTTIIVVIGFTVVVTVVAFNFNFNFDFEVLLDTRKYGLLSLSTFFTSFFIFVFAMAVFLAKISLMLFSFAPQLFRLIAVSGRPVQVLAGGGSILMVCLYLVGRF